MDTIILSAISPSTTQMGGGEALAAESGILRRASGDCCGIKRRLFRRKCHRRESKGSKGFVWAGISVVLGISDYAGAAADESPCGTGYG